MTNQNLQINLINDTTPIYYGARAASWGDWAREKVSNYFFMGGHVAVVLSQTDREVRVRLEERTQPEWLTLLKTISTWTRVIPAFFSWANRILREDHKKFLFSEKVYRNGTREVGDFDLSYILRKGTRYIVSGRVETGLFEGNILIKGSRHNNQGKIEEEFLEFLTAPPEKSSISLFKMTDSSFKATCKLAKRCGILINIEIIEPSTKETVLTKWACNEGALNALLRNRIGLLKMPMSKNKLSLSRCMQLLLNTRNAQDNQIALANRWLKKIVKRESFTFEEWRTLPGGLHNRLCKIAFCWKRYAFYRQLKRYKPNGYIVPTLNSSYHRPIYADIMAYVGEEYVTVLVCKAWQRFTRCSYKQLIFSAAFQLYPNLKILEDNPEESTRPLVSNLQELEESQGVLENLYDAASELEEPQKSEKLQTILKERNDIIVKLERELCVSWLAVKKRIQNPESYYFSTYWALHFAGDKEQMKRGKPPLEYSRHLFIDKYAYGLIDRIDFLHAAANIQI